jgi:hypothetical protein
LAAEEAWSWMQGQGRQPEPNLPGALLNDLRMISDQMRAALSGRPAQTHSGLPAMVRRQDRRRRHANQ